MHLTHPKHFLSRVASILITALFSVPRFCFPADLIHEWILIRRGFIRWVGVGVMGLQAQIRVSIFCREDVGQKCILD